jgi:hypothetical protein
VAKNTSWLQRTDKPARPFPSRGAAVAALKEELERALAAGWEKAYGSTTRGSVVLRKGDRMASLVVSTVDDEGYELEGRERTGRRMAA